jgi:hypothetical protein
MEEENSLLLKEETGEEGVHFPEVFVHCGEEEEDISRYLCILAS